MAQNNYDWMLPSNGLAKAGGNFDTNNIRAKPIQSSFSPTPGIATGTGNQFNSLASTLGPEYMKQAGIAPPGEGFNFGDAMGNFSMGAQGVMGLANAYTAYKQLGLMEDQLSMQKGIANRNIANQAATTNRMLDDRASMAAQMTSGAEYGTPEYLKAKEDLQTRVEGSPIA